MDIQARMTALAELGATWVMWLLVGLSVVAIAITLERLLVLSRGGNKIIGLRNDLRDALARHDLEGARAQLARSSSIEARIVGAGLESAGDGASASEERMHGATQLARVQLERRLAFLGTIGANAPFIGLLGTVIGVIRAFHELDSSGGKVSEGLMAEIGEALVATAIGLLVALPAVAAFNYFQRVIKTRLASADALGRELLAYLKRT